MLHAQGILTVGGHRGYHVATFGPEVTQQILEARLTLEYSCSGMRSRIGAQA